MLATIFFPIILFLTLIQASIPFLVKKTIVFGVTIPETEIPNPILASYRKIYTVATLLVGLLGVASLGFFGFAKGLEEEKVVLIGLAAQFSVIICSMILYLLFHIRITKLKRELKWGETLKKVRVADLMSRSKDEMLPSIAYVLPMFITLGLIAYTALHYPAIPDMIPTHWGPDGKPDAFSEKNPFSVIALLLILLVMQLMIWMINVFTKKSGVKLSAARRNRSRYQQMLFRKYTSWFMLLTSLSMTILLGFLQLSTIHTGLGGPVLMMAMPLGFMLIILLATGIYAFKIGQGGARIEPDIEEEAIPGITDFDDDIYWKAGVFYVNKNDPSIFVEKRFGVGWTINYGNPVGYLVILGPLVLILAISLLL